MCFLYCEIRLEGLITCYNVRPLALEVVGHLRTEAVSRVY